MSRRKCIGISAITAEQEAVNILHGIKLRKRGIGGLRVIEELKPCPFCGGEADIWRCEYTGNCYMVGCSYCHMFAMSDYEDEAIATWNRRVKVQDEN